MRLRLKVKDLVNLLVLDYNEDLARKYNLSKSDIRRIKQALRKGSWRFL